MLVSTVKILMFKYNVFNLHNFSIVVNNNFLYVLDVEIIRHSSQEQKRATFWPYYSSNSRQQAAVRRQQTQNSRKHGIIDVYGKGYSLWWGYGRNITLWISNSRCRHKKPTVYPNNKGLNIFRKCCFI